MRRNTIRPRQTESCGIVTVGGENGGNGEPVNGGNGEGGVSPALLAAGAVGAVFVARRFL